MTFDIYHYPSSVEWDTYTDPNLSKIKVSSKAFGKHLTTNIRQQAIG